ncbi:MAG: hypothetical protein APG09_01521 [Candidatus Methanofastidiosum methylothiophilum]|uniref:Uncharacterized protein n=1 Tax=Candidatus Methanofastidiosum methylothiophilum TaxID=1705564 RepID=A0A150JF96_9EURY|nr:MAG: hypothetical protein APG09_01521 [Candidatus Methanofastidiosum methylthiophilus]
MAGIKAIDTPSNPTPEDWEEAAEMLEKKKKEQLERKKTLKNISAIKESESKAFEEKVESVIEKASEEEVKKTEPPKEDSMSQYVDRRGLKTPSPFISIDQDIPKIEKDVVTESIQSESKKVRPKFFKFKPPFNQNKNIPTTGKKKISKTFLRVVIPLFALLIIGGILYNHFATFVKVKIFVESKPVRIETVLSGDKNAEEIDFESSKIPIKTEEKSKSLSTTITATGKAYKGEKAEGKINIFFSADCTEETQPITLEAGHTLTTTIDGKTLVYELKDGVTIKCDEALSGKEASIIATNFGREYNISTLNKSFTIQGHTEIFGKNTTLISGGTKDEYTVLAQGDIDKGVEELSSTAIEEIKSELREVSGDWVIIEDTILSAVDKTSIKTDKKVGEEATDVNLDLTVKGSATYYNKYNLKEKVKELLKKKAEEEKLFDSENDLDLELNEDIKTDISVVETKKNSIKIKIVASSTVKPKVNKDKIAQDLMGMGWKDGIEYLSSLQFAEKKPEAVFYPEKYPTFLKRFPDRKGGVLIEIKEIEVAQESD